MQRETKPGKAAGPGSDPSRRARARRGGRRNQILALLAVVAFGVIAVAVRPAYRQLERWRARTIAAQAAELVRQQRFEEAIRRYQTALALDPTSLDALRGRAGLSSYLDMPAALKFWQALLAVPGHSKEDLHRYVEFALRLQRFDLAEETLARMLSGTNVDQATRVLAADYHLQKGDPSRALPFAEEALREQPANRTNELRVARILVTIPDPDRQRDGLRRLSSLLPLPLSEQVEVLRALESSPSLPIPETLAYLDQVRPQLDDYPAAYFTQADLRLRLDPTNRAAIVAEAFDRHRPGPPAAQLQLCDWLNRIGEPSRVSETYTLDEAIRILPILPAYLESLALAGRYEELEKATAGALPIEPWMLASFRAAAAFHLKHTEVVREQWRRALEESKVSPARLQTIGDFALRVGATDHAIDAYNLLAQNELHRLAGYRRLARAYETIRDTERLRILMREWSARFPEDPLPDNAYAYLSALFRKDLDSAHQRATRLTERFPGRAAYRATLALVELRRNQAQAALRVFERAPADPRVLPPQMRLVYALVLDANGQRTRARDLVRDLPSDRLLPEEQDLLRRLIDG